MDLFRPLRRFLQRPATQDTGLQSDLRPGRGGISMGFTEAPVMMASFWARLTNQTGTRSVVALGGWPCASLLNPGLALATSTRFSLCSSNLALFDTEPIRKPHFCARRFSVWAVPWSAAAR